MSRSNGHTPDLSNYANEAKAAAERAVLGGLAFDLARIKTMGIEPEWFDDPQHQAIYIALFAYKHTHSTVTQCGPSALIQYIASTPELTGPFSDNNGASLDDIRSIIGNGHFDADLLESNVSVLREAAFEVWRRDMWAKSERLPQHRFIRQMEESLAALKSRHTGTGLPVSGLKVLNVEDIQAKPIDWLWPNRFPRSMFSMVAGDPGLGKSLAFCADLTARLSIGADMPDGSQGSGPGDVVLFLGEDDPEYTAKPRLERAGADCTRVKIVEAAQVYNPKSGKLEYEPFDIAAHVPLLADVLRKLENPLAVIIDPISEFIRQGDQHKGQDVRGAVRAFLDMLAEFKVAGIGLGHLNKSAGGKAAYRASGSLAFVALARSYYMVGCDPDDPHNRFLLPSKVNLAPTMAGLSYRIDSDGPGMPPFVHWGCDPVPMNGDQFLEHEMKVMSAKGKDGEESELARAEQLIRDQLKNGPVLSKELDSARAAHDLAAATFRRAKNKVGIRAEKEKAKPYRFWVLLEGQKIPDPPKDDAHASRHAQHEQHAHHAHHATGTANPKDDAHVDHDAHLFGNKGDEQHPPEDAGLKPNGKRTRKRGKAGKKPAVIKCDSCGKKTDGSLRYPDGTPKCANCQAADADTAAFLGGRPA